MAKEPTPENKKRFVEDGEGVIIVKADGTVQEIKKPATKDKK